MLLLFFVKPKNNFPNDNSLHLKKNRLHGTIMLLAFINDRLYFRKVTKTHY